MSASKADHDRIELLARQAWSGARFRPLQAAEGVGCDTLRGAGNVPIAAPQRPEP